MGYYNTYVSEKQTKKTYHLLNNEQGEDKFDDELKRMAKNTIYYLLYNGVPENVVPMVLEATKNYKIYDIKKDVFRRKKKSNSCVICGGTTNLTLHHIKPIKDYPELQFRADNLKPVCRQCHENLHELEF
jgi:hypothetical protein